MADRTAIGDRYGPECALLDGTPKTINASVVVQSGHVAGPVVRVTNLPAGDRVVAESGFAHLELAIEGAGPFVVEYGLREKLFWASRLWNVVYGRA